jgi:hypothetical protein
MKKVLFAAFAGFCILSSFRTTSVHQTKLESGSRTHAMLWMNDSTPGKKTDTSRYPKPGDTTSMPKMIQGVQ